MRGAGSLGVLGGTFNPPHLGHLTLARHARDELALERCVLVPARMPPNKPLLEGATPEQRLRMCELLIAEEDGLEVSSLEVDRKGPSYTVDTLSALHARYPEARLTFIVGADTACTLGSWREPERVLELAELAVAMRAGSAREDVLGTLRAISGEARVSFLEMGVLDVSSSLVRERAPLGEPLERLVGAPVAGYIAEQGLYVSVAEAMR